MTFTASHDGKVYEIRKGLRRLSCECCCEDTWSLYINDESDDWSPFDGLCDAQGRAEKIAGARLTWTEEA